MYEYLQLERHVHGRDVLGMFKQYDILKKLFGHVQPLYVYGKHI